MKIGSLCTGYGGLDMAVESFFNAETVWTCEFDKYASQVIEKRINKPNHGDLKTTDWTQVEPIDILTAGYPCQPFSTAGLRKGADDERHLWPYIKNIIGILRPKFVVLENVRGHFGLGFREVLSDLASCGYDATWRLVRASDVGAPHRRERLFILAYAQDSGDGCLPVGIQSSNAQFGSNTFANANGSGLQGSIRQRHGFTENSQIAANTNSDARTQSRRTSGSLRTEDYRLRTRQDQRKTRSKSRFSREMDKKAVPAPLDQGKLNAKFVEYMMGLPKGWVTDIGLSRTQQLKILGNGVVPQQAEYALKLLWEQACG